MYSNVNAIAVNITRACNFKCSYCYAEFGKTNKALQFNRDNIPYLYDIIGQSPKLTSVAVMGGEPTICWDLSRDFLMGIKNLNYSGVTMLSTNCFLITDKVIEDMASLGDKFRLDISFNPIKDLYNEYRGFSDDTIFNTVRSNIDRIVNANIKTQGYVVITDKMIPNMFNIVKAMFDCGFSEVIAPIDRTIDYNLTNEQWEVLDIQYGLIYDYVTKHKLNFVPFSFPFFGCSPKENRGISRCACPAHKGGKLIIETDGTIYSCCYNTVSSSNVGHVTSGLDLKKYNRCVDFNYVGCKDCEYISACRRCMGVSLVTMGTSKVLATPNNCNLAKIIFKYRQKIWDNGQHK